MSNLHLTHYQVQSDISIIKLYSSDSGFFVVELHNFNALVTVWSLHSGDFSHERGGLRTRAGVTPWPPHFPCSAGNGWHSLLRVGLVPPPAIPWQCHWSHSWAAKRSCSGSGVSFHIPGCWAWSMGTPQSAGLHHGAVGRLSVLPTAKK